MNKRLGWIAGISAMISFSTLTPIGRYFVTAGIHPVPLLFFRYSLTILLLGLTMLVMNPRLFRIDGMGLKFCMLAGLLESVSLMSYFFGLSWISGSLAVIIASVYPLFVLALLALRGEKFTWRNLIRVGLGILGVYFLVGITGTSVWQGVVLAFIPAITFSIYLVLMQWFLSDYDARTVMFYVVSSAWAVMGLWWIVSGIEMPEFTFMGWLAVFWLAFGATYIARLATFTAVKYIGSAQFSLLGPLEVLSAVLLSIIFLNEQFEAIQWMGAVLVILSVFLAVQRIQKSDLMT